ncbi:oxygenase MpaB family protein [Actinospongicola halichondriae]|uniref:oxygenase MpaB family protein n=1 Tax=Actinospongicola halichondriae TaxID=3236844 RepID=UPI003D4468D1
MESRERSLLGSVAPDAPPDAWPADSEAFDRYWTENLQRLEVDDVTRDYLIDFLRLRWLGRVPSFLLGGLHTWISAGYLSDEFRRPLGLRWTDTDQRRFDRLFATLVRIDPIFPDWFVRIGPRLYLWDFRRRHRGGKAFT